MYESETVIPVDPDFVEWAADIIDAHSAHDVLVNSGESTMFHTPATGLKPLIAHVAIALHNATYVTDNNPDVVLSEDVNGDIVVTVTLDIPLTRRD